MHGTRAKRGDAKTLGHENPSAESIFKPYLQQRPLFKKDRDILRPSYIPERLPHRDMQIDTLASILSTALKGGRPSNVLIFGKTGTGKTAVAKYLGNAISKAAGERALPLGVGPEELARVHFVYINCEVVDTQYGVLAHIGNRFISDWDERIPFTGWPTEKVYDQLKRQIDELGGVTVIVLDEIDKLVYKSGDDVLFHLTQINDDLSRGALSVVAISNDLKFTEFLDARVRSRLGEERLVFPPYNAKQLQDILAQRAELALEAGMYDESVIALCAALAAQEHGDARRALDLLRVSGELAERDGAPRLTDAYVVKAKNKIELDCVTEVVRTLPLQSKIVLIAIYASENRGEGASTTGEVYDAYRDLCRRAGYTPLTQRRVTDFISELDMLGIITARLKSFGRGGRTREISLGVSSGELRQVLVEDEMVRDLVDFVPTQQKLP
ncbi:MAG TPA: ORC1-type DNA replication protein [Candidatus Thermoplasmatota archaeon]